MNLDLIKNNTKWEDAANSINSNFNKTNLELTKIAASSVKHKGYFTTEAALLAAQPSPKVGDNAYVGATYPGVVYICNTAGMWTATTTVPSPPAVNITEYYKKTETDTLVNGVSGEVDSLRADLTQIDANASNRLFHILTTDVNIIANIDKLENAIPSIYIYGNIESNAKYSIAAFGNTPAIHMIRLFKQVGGINTEVCSLNETGTSAYLTGINTITIPEYNNSGVFMRILIDWDKLKDSEVYGIFPNTYYCTEKCFNEAFFNLSIDNLSKIKTITKSVDIAKDSPLFNSDKNLFNNQNILDKYWIASYSGEMYIQGDGFKTTNLIRIKPNTDYTLSGFYAMGAGLGYYYAFYSLDGNVISYHQLLDTTTTFTSPNYDNTYIYFAFCVERPGSEGNGLGCQLEEGSSVTSYETFKLLLSDIHGNEVNLDTLIEDVPNIIMPTQINVAVGRQCNIYKDNVSDILPDHDYYFEKTLKKQSSDSEFIDFKRNARYSPTSVKSLATVFNIRRGISKPLFAQNVVFSSVSKTAGSGTKNLLWVGDSLSAYGAITGELLNLFTVDGGGQIELMGHIGTGANKYEARGGWTFRDYATNFRKRYYITVSLVTTNIDTINQYLVINGGYYRIDKDNRDIDGNGVLELTYDSGTSIIPASGTFTYTGTGSTTYNYTNSSNDLSGNPFWDTTTSALNFQKYMNVYNPGKNLDIVVFQLGINDLWGQNESYVPTVIEYATTLKEAVLASYPNCKVVFSLEPYGPYSDGYSGLRGSTELRNYRIVMFKLYTGLIALSGGNVSIAYSNLWIDRLYGYAAVERMANSRTTMKVVENGGGSNDVHPSIEGSCQIADCIYSQIRAIL